jgi:hypothetical protein
MKNNQLRIKIGPNINKDFQVFLGDEDVTEKLSVKSVEMKAGADDGLLHVTLDIYADGVEILTDEVVLRVEEWPLRRSFLERLRIRLGW